MTQQIEMKDLQIKMICNYGLMEMRSLPGGRFLNTWRDENGNIEKQTIDGPYVVMR